RPVAGRARSHADAGSGWTTLRTGAHGAGLFAADTEYAGHLAAGAGTRATAGTAVAGPLSAGTEPGAGAAAGHARGADLRRAACPAGRLASAGLSALDCGVIPRVKRRDSEGVGSRRCRTRRRSPRRA